MNRFIQDRGIKLLIVLHELAQNQVFRVGPEQRAGNEPRSSACASIQWRSRQAFSFSTTSQPFFFELTSQRSWHYRSVVFNKSQRFLNQELAAHGTSLNGFPYQAYVVAGISVAKPRSVLLYPRSSKVFTLCSCLQNERARQPGR